MSGNLNPLFSLLDDGIYQTVRLSYYCKDKSYHPFPKDTHGYLYYCTPSRDRPPLSGSFRFRVLPPTLDRTKGFSEGTDLVLPDGRPWELSLYSAIHSPGFAPLVRKLLNEKLLETDLLDTVAKLPRTSLRKSSVVLYTLSDPFTWSLDQVKMMTILTEDHLVNFKFNPLIDQTLGRLPFTGI